VPGGHLLLSLVRAVRSSAASRYQQLRGRLVLLDRCPDEAVLPGNPPAGWGGRLVSALFVRLAPRPDLLVVLDAPGTVMFARKGEHSAALLERQRQEYLRLAARADHGVVIDATQTPGEIRRSVLGRLWGLLDGCASSGRPLRSPARTGGVR
jgi:thymidylate kinase